MLYCVEAATCATVSKDIGQEAPKLGGELVYSSPVSLTQTDFTAQCQNAKTNGARALGLGMDGAAIARVARSCTALGYHPQFISSALVLSGQQAEDPNIRRNTLSTANSNPPLMRTDTPGSDSSREP